MLTQLGSLIVRFKRHAKAALAEGGVEEDDDDFGDMQFEDAAQADAWESSPNVVRLGDGAHAKYALLSPKVLAVVSAIASRRDGKHYVYTRDKRALGAIALLLQQLFGYSLVRASKGGERARVLRAQLRAERGRAGAPGRFDAALAGMPEEERAGGGGGKQMVLMDAPSSLFRPYFGGGKKEASTAGANAAHGKRRSDEEVAEGRYGETARVRVFLASGENFKGVDIKHLRYLHLVDPLPRYSDYLQFVGRGARNCGHAAERDPSKRLVDVFLYRLVGPDGRCDARATGARARRIEDLRLGGADQVHLSDCWLWNDSKAAYAATWATADAMLFEASVDNQKGASVYSSFAMPELSQVPTEVVVPTLSFRMVKPPGDAVRTADVRYKKVGGG